MSSKKILYQGAEAIISLDNNIVKKHRLKKPYRISEIDEKLRKLRTKSEAKLLEKLKGRINVPKIIEINDKNNEVIMEFIKGKKLSEHLDSFSLKQQEEICRTIGEETGKFHDLDIIHGDLTTSNMILADGSEESNEDCKIVFIDFGLGFHSQRKEDKAVDLHLLKQALEAKHFQNWEKLFNSVLQGYKKSKNSKAVISQLKIVESRGRYKH
ncbi:Kae1-associated kinase Bud32 [Candidatus Woesearchaeota archaeon CG10_big_fil_rev_8_21_14_0_10_34_12]|nr:MAG: Kae1-associated kinase Bud32 [Candidatus Woesearchaeota archaeon CG10_big_fil_rev_8_21_14_0_10_34_12]